MALKVRDPNNKAKDVDVKANASGVVDEVEELKKKLYTDPVFGCQNRAKFEEDVKELGDKFTYFTFDVNNLKLANDKYGHESGDELLKVSADLGRQVFGDEHFYRNGGDEMSALFTGVVLSVAECDEKINEYKRLLEEEDKKHEYPVAVSMGYASSSIDTDLEIVMKIADEMMYSDKKEYKEKHPEYDMRRARVTVDTVKQAIEDGTFHEYVEQMRAEKGEEPKPKPVLEEIDENFDTVEEDTSEDMKDMWQSSGVEIDETVDSVAEDELPAPVKKAPISSVPEVYEDLSAGNEEEAYRQEEFANKVNPILHETTKKAVSEAVKAQNDKVKLEISEVLQDEVSYRLGKYEKRRKRRDLKEKIGFCVKGVVLIIVFLIIFGNAQIRLRISLVAKDAGEIISDLLRGKDTSSNKLVEDLFRDLGDDINNVNTIDTTKDKGFNIEEGAESNE